MYFIADGVGHVKIGVTSGSVETRLAALQIGNAHTLTIAGVCRGGYPFEAELHDMFKFCRVQGEWFRLTEPLAYLLESLNSKAA